MAVLEKTRDPGAHRASADGVQ